MDKQIVSRFYLITLDDNPLYIGFTNRDIATRFREHKHDKELPDNAKVKEIDKLVYDFSWDVATVNKNAKEVSDREAELIEKYGTQDSIYQKAIGGGQVWNEIKHFIIINREDPFWQSMPEDIILATIEKLKAKKVRMNRVINGTRNDVRIGNVISNTDTSRRIYDLIRHTDNRNRISDVIKSTTQYSHIESVIKGTDTSSRISHVISGTDNTVRLNNVISHTTNSTRIGNVIRHTRNDTRLSNIISNTKTK